MNIQFSSNVPDGTYFNTGACEPDVKEDALVVYDGQGSRRSWGAPGVTSTVIYQSQDFVAVHVGFHHKHGGGQFWRYYSINGEIKQVKWAQLDDSLRAEILEAYEQHAPRWANVPGKLRKDYIKPSSNKMTTYKAVAVDNDRLVSLYDSKTEYTLGKRLAEAVGMRAGEDFYFGEIRHDGGYYSHPSIEKVKSLLEEGHLVPVSCLAGVTKLAIIECEISGRFVRFPNGKLASTYLTPVKVIETIEL